MEINLDTAQLVLSIAQKASDAILKVYETEFESESKADSSPITIADRVSQDIINKELVTLFPNIPIISEEQKNLSYEIRKTWEYCWIVDPLDGTKEFIKKNGEFTVNIALIHHGIPIMGVVYIPVQQVGYFALKNLGAYKITNDGIETISSSLSIASSYDELMYQNWKSQTLKIVASRSHLNSNTEDFIHQLENNGALVELVSVGSSLKFCLIAEGKADIYPRFAPTMEWDTAAAQVIAEESGKKVVDIESLESLKYNKSSLFNNGFIVF